MNIHELTKEIKKLKLKALYFTRPDYLFNEHFQLEHNFIGVVSHRVHESFIIKPVTDLAIFMFHEDVQFMKLVDPAFIKVQRFVDRLTVDVQINSERESEQLKSMIKKIMLSYFVRFVSRFEQDERIKYVAQFCSGCRKYNSMPLNRCVMKCTFEPITKDNAVPQTHTQTTIISAGSEC